MEWQMEEYTITTDKSKIDITYVHHFLSTSYWAEGIPLETVQRSIDGALSFGIFYRQQQVGFARVITDGATFAYLADVFVDESYRGRGLSKWLVQVILAHPQLQGLRRFVLITRDAHRLYEKFGFGPITHVDLWMQKHQPGLYKKAMDAENESTIHSKDKN